MSQPPLDTLKIRAYGVKNPTHTKKDRTSPKSAERYYPKDRRGNYDEWAAVLNSQHQAAQQV